MTSRLIVAVFAAAALTLTGCPKEKKPTSPVSVDGGDDPTKPIGALLGSAAYPPAMTPDATPNPITVPLANVVILYKVDLPSEVDGAAKWIGVECDAATAAKLSPVDVFKHPRDNKIYRRLQPGDFVKRDQIVAMLDDEAAYYDWKGADTKATAAKESAAAYGRTVKELEKIVDQQKDGVRRNIVPLQELYNSQATLARYLADEVEHKGSAEVAISDAQKAKVALDKRTIRAAVDGQVQQVLKHEGEGVKASEPVLVIHDFNRLRAVGNLPKEYVNLVSPGDDVTIEVPRDVPYGTTFEQHTTNKPIVAIAVGVVDGKPVIVSAADDGLVYVWDRDLKVLGSWRIPAGVRSLAVTRPGVEPAKALVGGADGIARVYALNNPSAEPKEFEGRHEGGVTAAAFSPDGQYCVTADERGIYMYDKDGKRKYTFSTREHHSPITSLAFTPQGRVVSVGREPSVRVWQVGKDGAKVEHRIDSRSGDITSLGVSDDGARLLLDADKTHLDIIHLQELRKERPLTIAGEAARFTTFAAWSPDAKAIATTGGAEGVVQLWRSPTAKDRAAEIAHFVTRGSAAATCAAFSPLADNGFVVVGTKKGVVHLWPLPAADMKPEVKATVTFVEQNIDSSGRTVNVLVDFDNPKLGENQYMLRPGAAVTLVIRPKR
jgi:WD40 repeat protein